jgi:hypothetical protein
LARIAADEQYMLRRRINVQNFGSGWLRPPGVHKTLHQMREEKREQEEHQEALRREQLAQELADAEAGDMQEEDGVMEDVQLDGAQDLDAEIPDADADADLALNEDDDDEDEDEEEEEDEQGSVGQAGLDADEDVLREGRQAGLMAARMRMTDDAFREALIRGEPEGGDMYGGEEELEEEEQGHMLDEEDFVQVDPDDDDLNGDMMADLDDEIPEAESGGYEHTDSEAELSSYEDDRDDDEEEEDDDDAEHDIGFAPRAAPLGPPLSPTLRGRRSPSPPAGRTSMDLSNILSQDESSFMESSPAQLRRARHG